MRTLYYKVCAGVDIEIHVTYFQKEFAGTFSHPPEPLEVEYVVSINGLLVHKDELANELESVFTRFVIAELERADADDL